MSSADEILKMILTKVDKPVYIPSMQVATQCLRNAFKFIDEFTHGPKSTVNHMIFPNIDNNSIAFFSVRALVCNFSVNDFQIFDDYWPMAALNRRSPRP